MSETFTHAILNTQEDTGDPLFMLQARQQGILEDDYIYMEQEPVSLTTKGLIMSLPVARISSFLIMLMDI